jgi:hypothetical protein
MADDVTPPARIRFPDYPPMDETGTVDLWQIEYNLSLSPAERLKRFEGFLELCQAFQKAGMKQHGHIPATDSAVA